MSIPVENISSLRKDEDERERTRAYSSATWRIIPLLSLIWLMAWVDRANIAFAKLQMLDDLGFSEAVFGFGAGIFFVGYVLFAMPGTLLLKKLGAKRTISSIVIGWGGVSLAMTFIHTPIEFYVLRILLGVFEAAFYPGVILYLTYWFPERIRTRNFGIFQSFASLSPVVVGLSGAWVFNHTGGLLGLSAWRWMFLVQAIPTMILGLAAVFVLTDQPSSARWLSDRQKKLVGADLRSGDELEKPRIGTFNLFSTGAVWLLIAVYFCTLYANAALVFFMPTILKFSGFASYSGIGAASAIICVIGALLTIVISASASRKNSIKRHFVFCSLCISISFVSLPFSSHGHPYLTTALLALALGAMGAAISLFWQFPPRILAPTTVAVAIGFISSVANLGGFVSPWLIGLAKTITGDYSGSFVAVAVVQMIGAVLLLVVMSLSNRSNNILKK
ncbi:MFS transporter [Burkholderia sp. Ac-20384]|uniref:MFS transporter n=1 Tax=Burkholderia sp. Ac-20384 TaxID=2703902 RepID=UPI00197CD11F|nr:MFS transporter [Burkholderia sp. Ac-20384]MBN3823778.1 MFS transporter [Burkholderia sp. Ac-20384]